MQLYDIPVVILIDFLTVSAGEFFAVHAEGTDRFTLIGTNTAGMPSNATQHSLPHRGVFQMQIFNTVNSEGVPISNRGVMPDIWVDQTLADMILGVDTQLKFALDYIRNRLYNE